VIHKIHIQNFKSLHDVEVDLAPLTVLIGRSGSGKTNFVDAIRFLRSFLAGGQNFLNSLSQLGEWRRTTSASLDQPSVDVECRFSVGEIPDVFDYGVRIGSPDDKKPVQCLRESLSFGERTVFSVRWGQHPQGQTKRSYTGLGWKTEPDLIDCPDPRKTPPPFLAAFPAMEETVLAHVALTDGIGCYDFPGSILQPSTKAPKEGPNGGLHDNGANYLETMREIVSNLSDLRTRKQMVAALRQISPTVASVELDDHRDPKSAIVSHTFEGRGRLGLKLDQESEGLRRFYAHLLALNQVPPKQTLIFEEPEKGIYPGGLEVLAGELKNCAESGRSQVILTTHSPQLLDHFDPESIRVVEIDANATRIGPIAPEQLEAVKGEMLDTGELLTVDPARTESSVAQ